MQKVKSVKIKKIFLFLFSFFISFYVFSQKNEIKSEVDYIILNKTIKRYFKERKFSDSLFINSALYKENPLHKKILMEKKRRKKLDTLHIRAIADKIIFKQFLEKDARWKRSKYNKPFLIELNTIFSFDEVTNYNKQLENNYYLWKKNQINFKDRVFVENKLQFTQEEVKRLSEEKKNLELRKIYDLDKIINLFTFSKPIYSINNERILIAYNSGGTNILHIFKKINKIWQLEYTLNNNMIIDRVGP